MGTMETLVTDVLVLGCGPAGLSAAVSARQLGCRVVACDKGIIGNDCSAVGAKQIAGIGEWSVGDCADRFLADVLASGCMINDERLAGLMTREAGAAIRELQRLGMPFDRDSGDCGIAVEDGAPGHSVGRALHFGDITGKMIVETLYAEARRRRVFFAEEHSLVELLVERDCVTGALVLRKATGTLCWFRAKAVVLATGGLGQMYELTSNPASISGDGIAAALRAGAKARDLEFVQFYPVTAVYPGLIRGMNLNALLYGGRLVNSVGERFIVRYHPEELKHLTRDQLAQAIFKEIEHGRAGPHGGVFLDARAIAPSVYAEKVPGEWKLLVNAGIDLSREVVEVAPGAHYFMGGVGINERCASTLSGLFAAGECAAGVHGANRLANNGLSEAIVFGAIAGRSAAERALGMESHPQAHRSCVEQVVEKILATFADSGARPYNVVNCARRLMTQLVGIRRDENLLRRAEEGFAQLERQKLGARLGEVWDAVLSSALTARNMLLLGRAMARAARERRESRGAHFRSDFPQRDDTSWLCNLIISIGEDGVLCVKKRPITKPQAATR